MKLREKLLGFFGKFPKATVVEVAPICTAIVPQPVEVPVEPTTDPVTTKPNDAKGKNYKRSGKRGRARSKGSKTDSGLSN